MIRRKETEFWNRALAVLAAIFTASMQWTGGVAKNDCGIALWCLGALLLLQEGLGKRSQKLLFFAGVFTGLAFVGKISSVLFLGPFLGIFGLMGLYQNRIPLRLVVRFFLLFLFGFLLTSVPILLRMYLETGNPFFPMFFERFPSPWVSETLRALFAPMQPTRGVNYRDLFLMRGRELLHESPFVVLSLLYFPFLLAAKSRNLTKDLGAFLLCSFLVFLVFVTQLSNGADFRYFNATLFFFPLIGTLLLLRSAQSFVRFEKGKQGLFVAYAIVILAFSHLPTHLLWRFPKLAVGEAHLLSHTAGDAKAWLRKNTKAGEGVLILSENEGYYLSGVRAIAANNRVDTDKAIVGSKSFFEFLEKICATSHARYFLDSKSAMGLSVRFPDFVEVPEALVFRGADAKVYDLDVLTQRFLSAPNQVCSNN